MNGSNAGGNDGWPSVKSIDQKMKKVPVANWGRSHNHPGKSPAEITSHNDSMYVWRVQCRDLFEPEFEQQSRHLDDIVPCARQKETSATDIIQPWLVCLWWEWLQWSVKSIFKIEKNWIGTDLISWDFGPVLVHIHKPALFIHSQSIGIINHNNP